MRLLLDKHEGEPLVTENNDDGDHKDWKDFFIDNQDMPVDLKIRYDELLLKIYERRKSLAQSQ